jgi:uncharacterized membrane protein
MNEPNQPQEASPVTITRAWMRIIAMDRMWGLAIILMVIDHAPMALDENTLAHSRTKSSRL